MHLAAPCDGRVYHGEIRDGRWVTAAAAKFMKPGGKIPAHVPFATVIPEDAALHLEGFAGEDALAGLAVGQRGYVAPVSVPRARLPVTVSAVGAHPGLDGRFRVTLALGDRPAGVHLVPGMKGKVTIIIHDAPAALAVPVGALKEDPDGSYAVTVKRDGGDPVPVPVEVGVESSGQIEITAGLEPGEVVMVPDQKPKE